MRRPASSGRPTPLPVPSAATTIVRHAQGYTAFERRVHGLWHEMLLFVPLEDPVKLIVLKVKNPGDRPRRLSATFYVEWVLGGVRDTSALQVVTELDSETGALLARNAYRTDFAVERGLRRHQPAAVHVRPPTAPSSSAATARPPLRRRCAVSALSGRVGAALDPCAALHAPFVLGPGEETEIVFLLGEADDLAAAARPAPPLPRAGSGLGRPGGGQGALGIGPHRRPGADPRPGLRPAPQPLAPLPGLELPPLGALGALPVGGGLRLPRPAPGRHGPGLRSARRDAGRRSSARRRGSSPRATCSTGGTLPPGAGSGPGSPTTSSGFPWSSAHYVTTTGDAAILDEPCAVPGGARAGSRPGGQLRPAGGLGRDRPALRPLRAGAGARDAAGPARPAADGHRRLERRHEPRRRRGPRRERLARLVPADDPRPVRPPGRGAGRHRARRDMPRTGRNAPHRRRSQRLGRPLVSPRLLRRRHAPRLGHQRGVPDRPAGPGLGRDLRRRPGRTAPAQPWPRPRNIWFAATSG